MIVRKSVPQPEAILPTQVTKAQAGIVGLFVVETGSTMS